MNRREKIIVAGGLAISLMVVGWKLLRPGEAGAGDAATITGAIARIESGRQLRADVDALARELALALPQVSPTAQESAIRDDLGRMARECELTAISLKGIESTQRGASRQVQQVQYRLDLYGPYNGFMKLVTLLEKSTVPYVVKEISLESSPRPPAGMGNEPQQQPGGGQRMPGGREGRGGAPVQPPNGNVHGVMRVQSFLFPVEAVGMRSSAPQALGTGPRGGATPPPQAMGAGAQNSMAPVSQTAAGSSRPGEAGHAVTPPPSPPGILVNDADAYRIKQ